MITPDEQTQLKKYADLSLFSLEDDKIFQHKEQDFCGNYHFIKDGKEEKIQIIFQTSPIGILSGNNTEDECSVTILGNEKTNYLADSLVYRNETPIGVLRSSKDDFALTKLGDICASFDEIYTLKKNIIRKDDSLYGNEISSILSLYFADFITKHELLVDKCIDFTIWNLSLNGENGLVSSLRYSNADKIIFVSLISDDKNCVWGEGPALVLKDGNYILSQNLKSHFSDIISRENIAVQSYVGKSHAAMEQLDIHADGKPLLGIYLPIKHQNTKTEEINWEDVEKTRDVLLKCITAL